MSPKPPDYTLMLRFFHRRSHEDSTPTCCSSAHHNSSRRRQRWPVTFSLTSVCYSLIIHQSETSPLFWPAIFMFSTAVQTAMHHLPQRQSSYQRWPSGQLQLLVTLSQFVTRRRISTKWVYSHFAITSSDNYPQRHFWFTKYRYHVNLFPTIVAALGNNEADYWCFQLHLQVETEELMITWSSSPALNT